MIEQSAYQELPLPPHYDPASLQRVWQVPYQDRAQEARAWAQVHSISPSSQDEVRIALLAIDVQNTFCLPDFELYVGGRSGTGAIDDNDRLVSFIYRNLGVITEIAVTMDTHLAMQIFHPIFLVDDQGNNPPPMTLISQEDVENGTWKFNPAVAPGLGISAGEGQRLLEHYVRQLGQCGKYALTIWPYHAMLGGIGHALVSAFEEAVFFHSVARHSQPDFEVKGENPLTEHYSAVGPEILTGPDGDPLGKTSDKFMQKVRDFDAVIIAGQAKSHCVAWTVSDLLDQIREKDESLAGKVYLLEDCSSPVVVPGVVDYTDQAEAAFARFAEAGMHIVKSSDPLQDWPGIKL
jgi:nicotinamidase-related amidase